MLVSGDVEQSCVQFKVLHDAQLAIQREGLRHVADPAAGVDIARVHRLAEQEGLALAGGQQTGEHLHGGGLAAAVGAEKAEDFPALDAKAHLVHRDEIAETQGQVVGLDGDFRLAAGLLARRDHQRAVVAALFFRQQGDEGGFQIIAAGTVQQFAGSAGGQHATFVHGHQPVEALRLVHVGGGYQHAHLWAILANAGDQFPELVARQRVDASGGLIEDQQVGVVDQRAAQAELLFHAAGELARRAFGEGGQAGTVGEVGDTPLALLGILAEQPTEEVQVLEYGEGRVEILAQALRHVGDARTDPAAMRGIGHVAVQHLHPALLQPSRTGDQRQQAGLAYAIRADQADHAACRQRQAQVVESKGSAVAQGQVCDPRHWRCVRRHGATLTRRCSGHSASASSLR